MNVDLFDLERFVKVQDAYDSYDIALQEIKNGRKESHWMWYIFPQVQGLGHSSMSQRYSIKSLLEAKAFLEDDTLGKRLYETMRALPVYGDAEDIFGVLDAMKLRSCLTLFDLVSPDDIFSDFLENYFNKVRCQKTLKIVASELSYYKEDNAFQRNGIHEPARAFFESGICEAEQIDYEQRIGTLWDLLRRGETMRKLLSQYFWTKDFSVYRVSGVRSTILGYVRTVFQEIADNVHDDALFKEMNGIYNQYQLADDDSVFLIADAIDEFMKAHCDDKDIKSVLDTLIKHSLCCQL